MYKYKVVSKKRFYLFIISLLISIFFSGFFVINATANSRDIYLISEDNLMIENILVEKGDTLWQIALKYKSDNMDVRDMVEIIKDYNNLKSSRIYSGSIIKIPLIK